MFRNISIILLCLLAACQSNPDDDDVTEAVSQIEVTAEVTEAIDNNFIVWGQSFLTAEIDNYMKTVFEERHPEINVVFVDSGWDEALRQNLENSLQMGRPPEIVIGENYFRSFAARGDLQIVDSVYDNYDDVIPATYQAAIYEDHIYAVPYLTGVFAFERNCTVVESAGFDCDTPPEYWDELLEEVTAITQAGLTDYYGYTLQGPGGTAVGSAFRVAVYQSQLDALPCADEACTIPDFNRPETIPVYEFVRELAAQTPPGLIENTNENEVYEALFRGLSAYQIAGSWHPGWAETAGCEDCRYSSVPRPRDGQTSNMIVGNVLYAAPANSQHPDLALEWLELLLSDEVQAMIYPESGRLPVRSSTLSELQNDVDEATGVFINELLTNENIQLLPQFEENPRRVWEIYSNLLEAVMLSDRPIESIMAEAQTDLEALND